jgi:glutaredoxin
VTAESSPTRELRRVVLYTAAGCHLCEQARDVLREEDVAYDEIDITGAPALEELYREWLPVVEIDGERAFVYRVPREGLRRRLAR